MAKYAYVVSVCRLYIGIHVLLCDIQGRELRDVAVRPLIFHLSDHLLPMLDCCCYHRK